MAKNKEKNTPIRYEDMAMAKCLVLPPYEAATYAVQGVEGVTLSLDFIALIIRRYREGASAPTIARELSIQEKLVRRWVFRANELNILKMRDPGEETLEMTPVLERPKLEVDEDTDDRLSAKMLDRADMILNAITPDKIETAKLKDLTGALSQLVTNSRLLANKSTSNTKTETVVQYLTKLNSMSVAERLKLAEARGDLALPAPAEVIDVTPKEEAESVFAEEEDLDFLSLED